MCGRYKDHIMGTFARNSNGRKVEWLRIDLPVDLVGEELAEFGWRDIRQRKGRFVQILSRP